MTEVGHASSYLFHGFHQLFGRLVFKQVAGSASFERGGHDSWIVVHAEHEDSRPRTMRTDPSNERQPTKFLSAHLEVEHHHIGMVPIVESIAGDELACLQHSFNPCILKQASASLEDNRVIVDHKNGSHSRCARYAAGMRIACAEDSSRGVKTPA